LLNGNHASLPSTNAFFAANKALLFPTLARLFEKSGRLRGKSGFFASSLYRRPKVRQWGRAGQWLLA
jgi:hypothetical protein